jgi:hypothetical protein
MRRRAKEVKTQEEYERTEHIHEQSKQAAEQYKARRKERRLAKSPLPGSFSLSSMDSESTAEQQEDLLEEEEVQLATEVEQTPQSSSSFILPVSYQVFSSLSPVRI